MSILSGLVVLLLCRFCAVNAFDDADDDDDEDEEDDVPASDRPRNLSKSSTIHWLAYVPLWYMLNTSAHSTPLDAS